MINIKALRIIFMLLVVAAPQLAGAQTLEISVPGYAAEVGIHAAAGSATDIAVIALHGKRGGRKNKHNLAFAKKLSQAGYTVYTPQMPWDGYTATLETAYEFLDGLIEHIAADNKRVIIAGHSQGATLGNLYTTSRTPHAAVVGNIILAPGHILHRSFKIQEATARSVMKAKKLIKEGKGAERTRLRDLNQGQDFGIKAVPEFYITYFDLGIHPNFVSLLSKITLPTLWVDGEDDDLSHRMGYATMFRSFVPKTETNRYVVVPGDHVGMWENAHAPVLEWLPLL